MTYEISHLPPLKHRLIRACVIRQEPLLATNQSTQYNIRFCFGGQIQTQKRQLLLSYDADHPSKTQTCQQLLRADDNVRSTTRKQKTLNNLSDKINSLAYYFALNSCSSLIFCTLLFVFNWYYWECFVEVSCPVFLATTFYAYFIRLIATPFHYDWFLYLHLFTDWYRPRIEQWCYPGSLRKLLLSLIS